MAIYRNVSLSFWEDIKIVDDFKKNIELVCPKFEPLEG